MMKLIKTITIIGIFGLLTACGGGGAGCALCERQPHGRLQQRQLRTRPAGLGQRQQRHRLGFLPACSPLGGEQEHTPRAAQHPPLGDRCRV